MSCIENDSYLEGAEEAFEDFRVHGHYRQALEITERLEKDGFGAEARELKMRFGN